MPPMDETQDSGTDVPKELPPESEEGYRICIDCTNEGYEVYKEDLPPKPQEEENESQPEAQPIPDLTTAIKHVLALIKENPMGDNANDQLKAGYESA